jgi:histidine ammonia-lyase
MEYALSHQTPLNVLIDLASPGHTIIISETVYEQATKSRDYLDGLMQANDQAYYGINTGFGALCQVRIPDSHLGALQENLMRSHASGVGTECRPEIVRLMLALKVQSLIQGHSGVSRSTISRLVDLYNHDVLPVVFELGSLGASGDLAPLAHLCLPLLGEGDVVWKDKKMSAAKVCAELNWIPLKLQSKEGLALLNGTQYMSALGLWAIREGRNLMTTSNMCAALSLDAFGGNLQPFHPSLHRLRPYQGQITTAQEILNWLEKGDIQQRTPESVQDPYSFRCVPQVHGASFDALVHVTNVFSIECQSVSDNPLIFPDEQLILSGGNFHGQPLALALDYLAIALVELGSISERRSFQLLSGTRGLPPFMAADSGLHSGFMIPQYTAASLVSQNRQLATPASIDNVTSSNGQEDHVSMGANAGIRLQKIVDNLWNILGVEWMIASQAIDERQTSTAPKLEEIRRSYRNLVPALKGDRILSVDMHKSADFLRTLVWQ